jgi:hypothetical protein
MASTIIRSAHILPMHYYGSWSLNTMPYADELLQTPRPPGRYHTVPPLYGSGDQPTTWRYHDTVVCNCEAACRPVNHAVFYHDITPEQWRAWHGAAIVNEDTDDEEEDTIMPNAPRKPHFICANCHEKQRISARALGRLEVPITYDGIEYDRLCKDCADHHYIFARVNLYNVQGTANYGVADYRTHRWIRSATARSLRDVGQLVSPIYAERHCFRISTNNDWFSTPEAMHENEIRRLRNAATLLESFRRNPVYIFSYHEVNNVQLFGWPEATPRDSLCFGVELEMENRINRSRDGGVILSAALGGRMDEPSGAPSDRLKNRFVLARDGSLGESGIELITNPYTLDYHSRVFGWKELLKPAIAVGACAGKYVTSCGMHVHVNRAAISPLTLGKALIFVNSDANRGLIERVAQRASNAYTHLIPKKMADGRRANTSKYEAMHLTDSTVEFRIFRGNLRADRILKNIEFCHSVFGYVQTISARSGSYDYRPYLKFLVENAKLYPNLVAFLRENDSIAKRKGAPQIQISEEI